MNRSYLLILLLSWPILVVAQPATYDVVVYGGTSGGFTAAIQIARMGRSVALLEPTAHVGGMNIEGLGGTDIDNHPQFQNSPALGGLALEFYRRIARAYDREAQFEQALLNRTKNADLWRFEPSVSERVIQSWLAEHKIAVFTNARLQEGPKAVRKRGTTITQIYLDNGRSFRGTVFIDATIEGDLLHAAGVSTIIGREANATYGETKNGIRAVTDHAQFMVKVDPYRVPGDPASDLIATIQDEPLGTPGAGDHRLQAYCFRLCLTRDSINRLPFAKPAGYDRTQYEIYVRYEQAGGKLYRPVANLPNGKTDLGAWHDLSHNLYGQNFAYPGGNYQTRQRVYDQHRTFTQGLLYFLANDSALSAPTRRAWQAWGLCRDEFTDNGGWPRKVYVRDARRMVSDYVITEHHTRKHNPTNVPDPVAVAFWPPDVHSVRRIVRDGYAYNEGFVFGGNNWQPFGISYRALVPKATQCTNLLTPTCPSSSHLAYGAIRIEWTFMALGQAVGTAAVLAIQEQRFVQQIRYETLAQRLRADAQVLEVNKK